MSLPEDTKNEINEYLFKQQNLKNELVSEAKRELLNQLNDPERELTDNEKKLIRKTAKSYNIVILIITGITAISIIGIANLYSSFLELQTDQKLQASVENLRNKTDKLTADFEEDVEKNKNKIDKHIEVSQAEMKDIIDVYRKYSNEMAEKRGELDTYNKLYEEKKQDVADLLETLDSSLDKVSISQKQQNELEDKLEQLVLSATKREAELERYMKKNDQLINFLKNAEGLYVTNENGQFSFKLGELYIEWGAGTLDGNETTTITFLNPVEKIEDVGISIMGLDLRDSAFPEIKNLSPEGCSFRLVNPESKSHDYYQKTGGYRYLIVAALNE